MSQKSNPGYGWWTSKSFNRASNQVISQTVKAMALYSASAKDLETIDCFLDFHEINESPKNTQNPVVDLLVSTQDAQSASVKAFKWKSDLDDRRMPWIGHPLMYCNTLQAASRWGFIGYFSTAVRHNILFCLIRSCILFYFALASC